MAKRMKYKIARVRAEKSAFWKNKRILLIAGIAIIVLIIFIKIISSTADRKSRKQDVEFAIPVEVAKAKIELIRDTLYLTGRLQALSEVNVFSPVPGWLDRIYVDIGSRVSKRQVVASVDRNIIGSEYSKAVVKSPISGEVGRIFLDPGATVSPSMPIMSIVNYDKIKINLNIPEKYINRVKIGDAVLINVEFTDEEFIGRIARKSSAIDPLTGTFEAKVIIPNKKHKLKPGSFAKIRIVMDTKKTVVIPKDALVEFEEEKVFVYKVLKNQAKKQYVKTGIIEGNKVEITKGVKAGDLLITTGLEIVKDGSKVNIVGGEK